VTRLPAEAAGDAQRLDKWLFFARLLKSREKAQELVRAGHVRINGQRCETPAKALHPGDVLTIGLERAVLVVRVLALAKRRGPAEEAKTLYEAVADPVPLRRSWL
jgi:ribosome-associated heat shock protein Hsp15